MTLWTIGHSNRSLDDFVALLQKHEIGRVADIRTVPKSKRHPHFAADALEQSLPAHGIDYVRMPALGGFRKPSPDSPNAGWQHPSFRGYADYAMSGGFAAALDELRTLATAKRTAMMCSEAVWWRCHRRLVADRLVAKGDTVLHVTSPSAPSPHALTAFAELTGDGQIVYPAAQL